MLELQNIIRAPAASERHKTSRDHRTVPRPPSPPTPPPAQHPSRSPAKEKASAPNSMSMGRQNVFLHGMVFEPSPGCVFFQKCRRHRFSSSWSAWSTVLVFTNMRAFFSEGAIESSPPSSGQRQSCRFAADILGARAPPCDNLFYIFYLKVY